jgi:hypothetical protein
MRSRNNPMTPLAAVAAGFLAGAVGTATMDTVRYGEPPCGRYREPPGLGIRTRRDLGDRS